MFIQNNTEEDIVSGELFVHDPEGILSNPQEFVMEHTVQTATDSDATPSDAISGAPWGGGGTVEWLRTE